jgi:hypothetical protein
MAKSKPLPGVDLSNLGGLTERAVLVSCKISLWRVSKQDVKANQDLAQLKGISAEVTRVTKRLLGAQKCPEYEAITELAGQIRADHYKYTLPWYQNGIQILPNTAFWDYNHNMRAHMSKWPKVVQSFVDRHADIVDEARRQLGPLFNPDDYPWPGEMQERFRVDHSFLPMPAVGDFRCSLPSEDLDKMKEQLQQEICSATANAQAEVYERLYKVVNDMNERLWDTDNHLRSTSFNHVEELCGVLSKLNIAQDPRFDELVDKVRGSLTNKPKTVSDRNEQARKASEIRDQMADIMGMNPDLDDIDFDLED